MRSWSDQILVFPLLPGRQEAWRRLCQILDDGRAAEFALARDRLGILQASAWVAQTPERRVALLTLGGVSRAGVLDALAAATDPFERWLRHELQLLSGLDLSRPPPTILAEPLAVWSPLAEKRPAPRSSHR